MSTGTTAATAYTKMLDQRSARLDRLFYVIAACTMLFLTFVGFEPFYLHGKGFGGAQMTTQIVPLIVTHGLAMSSWVVLFLVQSLLIVSGNRRVHMTVGIVGASIAPVIVILGMTVATLSVHFNAEPYKLFGGARFFLGIMLTGMVLFGALVAVGITYRRRPEIHRPMMLLATVVLMTAPLDRWPFVIGLLARSVYPVPLIHYGMMLLVGAFFLFLQWGMTRALNRWYVVGYTGILVASFFSVALATSSLWDRIARIVVP